MTVAVAPPTGPAAATSAVAAASMAAPLLAGPGGGSSTYSGAELHASAAPTPEPAQVVLPKALQTPGSRLLSTGLGLGRGARSAATPPCQQAATAGAPTATAGATPSASSSSTAIDSSFPEATAETAVPAPAAAATRCRPRRVNIANLGGGAYRSLYLQAVDKCDDLEVTEDAMDDDCDLYFIVPVDREELHRRLLRLRPGARVNHFPGMVDVCEKVSFCRAVRHFMALHPRLGDFVPPTWIIPDEITAALEMIETPSTRGGRQAWIVKPEYGLQGNGIFIVRTRADLQVEFSARRLTMDGPRYVFQQYLGTPLTLDGYKFDLRLYVILTSLDPLEATLCHEGLARFCTTPYSPPSATNISVKTGHLTNYALNSKQENFARIQAGASAEAASKRLLSATLKQVENSSGGKFSEVRFWEQMDEIVAMLMVALVPALVVASSRYYTVGQAAPRSYHVLGLDVLLDEDYWPWLLEVNSAPAMDIETAVPVSPPPMPADAATSLPSARAGARRGNSMAELR
mmetsp:Transcript_107662/g.240175  ORF Transcript_107662/g.240175 Transcript_107662/m.240175 type:complete len:517 (-) Transcript_107662:11-1561(-)